MEKSDESRTRRDEQGRKYSKMDKRIRIFRCWEWENGENWWQIGKNGRTLFDRPKPTVGCSANGRRRRRRRRILLRKSVEEAQNLQGENIKHFTWRPKYDLLLRPTVCLKSSLGVEWYQAVKSSRGRVSFTRRRYRISLYDIVHLLYMAWIYISWFVNYYCKFFDHSCTCAHFRTHKVLGVGNILTYLLHGTEFFLIS